MGKNDDSDVDGRRRSILPRSMRGAYEGRINSASFPHATRRIVVVGNSTFSRIQIFSRKWRRRVSRWNAEEERWIFPLPPSPSPRRRIACYREESLKREKRRREHVHEEGIIAMEFRRNWLRYGVSAYP